MAVPVLAIGGVVADKVGDIAASGAAGVAAIGLFANVPTDANDAHFDRALQELVARLRAPFQREPAASADAGHALTSATSSAAARRAMSDFGASVLLFRKARRLQ